MDHFVSMPLHVPATPAACVELWLCTVVHSLAVNVQNIVIRIIVVEVYRGPLDLCSLGLVCGKGRSLALNQCTPAEAGL